MKKTTIIVFTEDTEEEATPEPAREETIEEKRARWAAEHEEDRRLFMADPLSHPPAFIHSDNQGTHFTLRMTRGFTREEILAWVNALPPGVKRIDGHRSRSHATLGASLLPGRGGA